MSSMLPSSIFAYNLKESPCILKEQVGYWNLGKKEGSKGNWEGVCVYGEVDGGGVREDWGRKTRDSWLAMFGKNTHFIHTYGQNIVSLIWLQHLISLIQLQNC